jgi:hypothetical protein
MSDNSTTGADQGQDIPDDGDAPGWECEECGHTFFVASAWSGPDPECKPGVLCPECGAFVPDTE